MKIRRILKTDKFTLGEFEFKENTYFTLERPWKGNQKDISCIPHGLYNVVPYGWKESDTTRFKHTYQINDVLNRSYILIHIGNYVHESKGCLLIGTGFSIINGEAMVTNSTDAMNDLRDYIGENAFELEIKDC